MKKTVSILLALMLALALLSGCAKQESGSPAVTEVTFRVVFEDGSEKAYQLSTEYELLSDALAAAGVISQEEAATAYILTAAGVTADYSANEAWWMLLDSDGNQTVTGVGGIKTKDADGYSLKYQIGF